MFDLESGDQLDLSKGPSQASAEGRKNLFDHRWVWMSTFLFIIGGLVRNNALMALAAFMFVTISVSLLWNRFALQKFRYWRRFPYRRAFPGERLEVQIVAENAKWLPLFWLQTEDEWPVGFGPEDDTALAPSSIGLTVGYLVNAYALRWNERVRRRFTLLAARRGLYPIGPAHVISGDPFGLFESDLTFTNKQLLVVYPQIKPLEEFGLDAQDPFGDVRVRQRLFEDPMRIMGIRDYRPDDSFRHIHWPGSARTGDLQVRQYEPTRNQSLTLAVNMVTFVDYRHGVWPEMVEYMISLAASLASWAVGAEYSVGLIANAAFSQTDRPLRTQPGHGHDQLAILLEAMAGITNFITADYAPFLLDESARMSWGTTIVALSAYVDDSIALALTRLRQHGRRVVLYVLGQEAPPGLGDILVYHLPMVETGEINAGAMPLDLRDDAGETPRDRYLRERGNGPR